MLRLDSCCFSCGVCRLSNFSSADEVTLRFPRPGKDTKDKKSEVSKLKGKIDAEKSNASKLILAVGKDEEAIEVTNIEGIAYDREPAEFATIRTAIANGSYNEAATEVQRLAAQIEAGNVPPISGEAAKKDLITGWRTCRRCKRSRGVPRSIRLKRLRSSSRFSPRIQLTIAFMKEPKRSASLLFWFLAIRSPPRRNISAAWPRILI